MSDVTDSIRAYSVAFASVVWNGPLYFIFEPTSFSKFVMRCFRYKGSVEDPDAQAQLDATLANMSMFFVLHVSKSHYVTLPSIQGSVHAKDVTLMIRPAFT